MVSLNLSLLGPFAATLDERPLTKFTTNRVQALLIYLAVEAVAAPVRRDVLMDILWPDLPQESAQTNLRQTLYRLRKTIPKLTQGDGEGPVPFLLADRQTVQINPDGRFHLDVQQFTELLKSDESRWPEAVDLYRGSFLADFYLPDSAPFEEWAESQRSTLLRQALDALDTLAARSLETGELDAAETYARRQLELDNLRESAHRQLMEGLVRNGRRRAALTNYETCRQLLRDELDIEPTLETQKLYESIRAGQFDDAVTPASAADLASPIAARKTHNLPRQTTTFFGRETELQTLHAFLADPTARLITIVGPGGMGKTRLALETARQQLAAFDHGVWFASLSKLASPEEIVPATAQALQFNFYEGREPRQQLLDYLRNKSLLLVMDNYEHLLDGVDLVTDVLQTAPQVKVLATSREPLRLVEEQLFPLSGLAFSREDVMEGDAAVQLFLERARHLRPDLTLKADDVAHITTICRQVEGMPLGLELAATWADTLSLAEIAAELQGSLDLLESDMRNITDRHRSLRAVFGASWDRLQSGEQQLFAQLSIFRGGFTRTAAKAICAPDVSQPAFHRLLAALTRKSFLKHDMENGRYNIHELLRQFGAEKLKTAKASKSIRDAHSAFYGEFLYQQEAHLKGRNTAQALNDIEHDIKNIEKAFNWAVSQKKVDEIKQVIESLYLFFSARSLYREGEELFGKAVIQLSNNVAGEQVVMAKAQVVQGVFNWLLGQETIAKSMLENSIAIFRKTNCQEGLSFGLEYLGMVFLYSRFYNPERSLEIFKESLKIRQQIGKQWEIGWSLFWLGRYFNYIGPISEGKSYFQASLAVFRKIGNPIGIAYCLRGLSRVEIHRSDAFREVEQLGIESASLFESFNDQGSVADVYNTISLAAIQSANMANAEYYCQKSLAIYLELGDQVGVERVLRRQSQIAYESGKYEKAQQIIQKSLAISAELRREDLPVESLTLLGLINWKQGRFSQAKQQLQEVLNFGKNHEYPPIFVANAYINLGHVTAGSGEFEEAKSYYLKSLELLQEKEVDETIYYLEAFTGLAYILG